VHRPVLRPRPWAAVSLLGTPPQRPCRRFASPHPLSIPALAFLAASLTLPAAAAAQGAPLSALRWRSVGPYIGGRVVAVTGVRGNPNLFYMGAVDGGVWKSTDYGIRWTNITDSTLPGSSNSIGAIAVAPANTNVIYVGTGESDIRGDVITGDGVFRSADAGKTWTRAGLEDTHTISNLIVDPSSPDVVYASSLGHVFQPNPDRGVFKTTDGGHTWQKILFVNDSTGCVNLVMDASDANVLYAAMWQAYRTPWSLSSGGAGSGIYKTTDGGAHWTDLSHNPGLPGGQLLGKIGLAVAASAPNVVYATIQARDGGVFRSDDGGATWRRVNDEWKLRQRAFYYMAIFVDPKDPNTVYMPEVDALFVSHDGAKTFTRLRTPHGDNHTLWINPDDPGILLEGNDGGATVSTDTGRTWSPEHNQPTGQFYDVNLDDRFPFHIYGAQQDEGSYEGPSATRQNGIPLSEWKRAAYGESTPTVPDPAHPGVTYGSGYYSIFLRYDPATEEYESVSPWPHYQEGASSGELKYRFAWTHPILFSPANPNELLVGAQVVMKSDDRGRTWRAISPDLTRNDPATEAPSGGPIDLDQSGAEVYPYVSALAVSPRADSVIWAGSSDGLAHVTTDAGRHWQAVTVPGLPERSQISSIEPAHGDRSAAYLTVQRYMWDDFAPYVYKTTDLGRHWTKITEGLPGDEYVFAIRQDPGNPDLLFLGTKTTVYVSLDAGAHWGPLSLNLPPVQVRGIAINSRQGDVVIATHGRSFWVLDNLALLEQMTGRAAPPADSAALFAVERAWLTHAYGRSSGFPGAADAGENPPFGATVFFQVPTAYDGSTPVSLTFTDSAGRTIRRFDLHLRQAGHPVRLDTIESPTARKRAAQERLTAISPGMNHFQWDLRYPDATEVQGFEPPIAAGGLPDEVDGPVIVPGSYRVALSYGGRRMEQRFTVSLDPRIRVGQSALARRLALELRIHAALDSLDRTINQAIGARDSLAKLPGGRTRAAALDSVINGLVQLDLHSTEGSLLHETKLRSHLAYLAAEIDLAYAEPTAAQAAVFDVLDRQAKAGEERLRTLMR
jgi:photosystem II stability/assembly factor-like uncharacterized protein